MNPFVKHKDKIQSGFGKHNNVDFDLKVVRGFALSYFIYGLVYWLQIGEFLVPLPMVYYFVPITGLLMFVRSLRWRGVFLYLLVPFVVLKDLTLNEFPNWSGGLLLFTFVSWSSWAWIVFKNERSNELNSWILPVSQMLVWLVWLVPSNVLQISVVVLMLSGVTHFVRAKMDDSKHLYNVRLGLLIQLVLSLYLMQRISVIYVELT